MEFFETKFNVTPVEVVPKKQRGVVAYSSTDANSGTDDIETFFFIVKQKNEQILVKTHPGAEKTFQITQYHKYSWLQKKLKRKVALRFD